MYSLSWFSPLLQCQNLFQKIIRLLSYSTKCIKHGVGYKGDHDAWECMIEIPFVISGVILGLFLLSDRLLSIAVSNKMTFWHDFFFFPMLVFTILLRHHFKCYWRVVSFGERLKGNVVILLCGRSLRGACRVVGKESSAHEFSFEPKMEIEAAVSTTPASVTMQDLYSSSSRLKLSVGL